MDLGSTMTGPDLELVQAVACQASGSQELPTEERRSWALMRCVDLYDPDGNGEWLDGAQAALRAEDHAQLAGYAAQIRAVVSGVEPGQCDPRFPTAAELVEHRRQNPEQWRRVA